MSKKEELLLNVKAAADALVEAQLALEEFEDHADNHVYESLEQAEACVSNHLEVKAHDACEGSHRFGQNEYTQEFIVDDMHYIGTLTVEYNRHDKKYYYVDVTEFTYAPKEA